VGNNQGLEVLRQYNMPEVSGDEGALCVRAAATAMFVEHATSYMLTVTNKCTTA
jgi:hypothetical protein